MSNKVVFSYADSQLALQNKTAVKASIASLCLQEGKKLTKLQYVFCSDEFLLSINRQHLNHDTYTDIITFDLGDGHSIEGEIYISVQRVKENAVTHHTSFEAEILRVLYHGALHLCGFTDKKKAEKELMRSKEDFYIQQNLHLVSRGTI